MAFCVAVVHEHHILIITGGLSWALEKTHIANHWNELEHRKNSACLRLRLSMINLES